MGQSGTVWDIKNSLGQCPIPTLPVINWKIMQENENEMNNVIKYIDSIVTTINPGINAPILEKHPCQKGSDELQDNSQQDYIELINKLQRHTRCSISYCICVNKRTG